MQSLSRAARRKPGAPVVPAHRPPLMSVNAMDTSSSSRVGHGVPHPHTIGGKPREADRYGYRSRSFR